MDDELIAVVGARGEDAFIQRESRERPARS